MTDEVEKALALPEGWLAVDALDIEAQGVARRPDGKVVFIEGALPFEQVSARVNRKKNNWEQATLTAIHRESSQRVRPRCPHFGLARGCVRRLQDAAPACRRAGGDQTARPGRQPLAPGQGQGRHHAAPDRGSDLGLPLARPLFGAACAQEGHSAGGFPRAQEPLCGRYPRMPRRAAARQRAVAAAARADRGHGRDRNLPADRAGVRGRGDGTGSAPPGAAECRRYGQAPGFRSRPSRGAVVAAAQRAGNRPSAGRGWARAVLFAARVRHHHALQADRLHAGESAYQPRAGPAGIAAARCRAR